MKIAIFDHIITNENAIGKCHLALLSSLADEHEFVVFAIKFDNPRPDQIRFVRIPAFQRPLLLMMILFHILAPFILWWHRLVKGEEFDLVQGIGGHFMGADLVYSHFCHRVYLREHGTARPKKPIRRLYSWFYDGIVSLLEPLNYKQAKFIVTPSQGLARELQRNFAGATPEKIQVIANPVDIRHMQRRTDFDRVTMRQSLGYTPDDFVIIFIGAGHFERKGLPILLDALSLIDHPRIKLLVVGGRQYMIAQYEKQAAKRNLKDVVQFVGFQRAIAPYLWSADIFAFPSSYEIFPLVSLEAAAAGVPMISAPLYGVEEFLQSGYNGWQCERTASAFADHIEYAFVHRDSLARMGANAVESVEHYTPQDFSNNWQRFYDGIESNTLCVTQRNRHLNQVTNKRKSKPKGSRVIL